ncbi:hypothetical protein [Caulobacter hibisci]|uniref:Uncharacterized protein n=1 Tax=Caulobacter hibisci TaxID=2035993 RepID=A0ABS0SRM7_9CAUL|nr:hypothetical protein [Caulobacter hibisci]MBI1682270.1 hypothetical protein [Caulobacter hibisci]
MPRREDMIKQEAQALWRELHGEPIPDVSGEELLARLCRDLDVADYDRVQSPFLRPSMIMRPEEWPEIRRREG